MGIKKFDFNSQTQFIQMLDKIFKIPLKDHHLFKDIYNQNSHSYFFISSSSKTEISSRRSFRNKITIYHDLDKELLNALFVEKDNYTYFIYFDKNLLHTKYKNQTMTTKMEVDKHLIPIKDEIGLFPNGSLKTVKQFHTDFAVKITTHYSLKGKEYKKKIEFRNDMFATILQKKTGDIEILSNEYKLKEFLEEYVNKIEDIEEILPLVELNFI